MGRIRFCASCGARLPRKASPRRRYCDDVCRAQAYRARRASDQIMTLAMMLADAEFNGDTRMIRLLSCPECACPPAQRVCRPQVTGLAATSRP